MSHFGKKTGESATELAALRAEIDAIDVALHDLVMRRTELTAHMGALKAQGTRIAGPNGTGHPFRPAREAAILRRLAARHSGSPPFAVVVQIWRELIAANLRRQCTFEVALSETGDGRIRDMARAAFGALTRITACYRPQEVIDAVSSAPGTLGILPAPAHAPPEHASWPELLTAEGAPQILCALPVLAGDRWPTAFTIGHAPAEPSGDDVSLVLLTGATPQAECEGDLARAGLTGRVEGSWPSMWPPGLFCCFAVLQGFVKASDPALARLMDRRRRDGGEAILIGTAPAPLRFPNVTADSEDTRHD